MTGVRRVVDHAADRDTVNNFPTTTAAVNARNATTSARQNNGVHPASTGSAQLADVMHHWIKGFES